MRTQYIDLSFLPLEFLIDFFFVFHSKNTRELKKIKKIKKRFIRTERLNLRPLPLQISSLPLSSSLLSFLQERHEKLRLRLGRLLLSCSLFRCSLLPKQPLKLLLWLRPLLRLLLPKPFSLKIQLFLYLLYEATWRHKRIPFF